MSVIPEQTSNHYMIGTSSFEASSLEHGLYIVATPIGNLRDITLRALDILAGADFIACEDTRTSRKLLDRFNIRARLVAYHEHNAEFSAQKLVEALGQGKTVALISDAGTPLISDPGYRLANMAREAGHNVVPIPGPSAVITALMAAGMPTDSFYYGGFLPNREKARKDRLSGCKQIGATLVFYESPHRLLASLKAAADVYGSETLGCVARELTKTHEDFAKGKLVDLIEFFSAGQIKGEIVLIISPPEENNTWSEEATHALLVELSQQLSTGQAASEAAKQTGFSRKALYQQLLEIKNRPSDEEK